MADKKKAASVSIALVAALSAGHVSGRLAAPSLPIAARPVQMLWVDAEPSKPLRYKIVAAAQVGAAHASREITCWSDDRPPTFGYDDKPISDDHAKALCASVNKLAPTISSDVAALADWLSK